MDGENKNITILGVGGAGCRIVGQLAQWEASAAIKLLALDTDEKSLRATMLSEEQMILAGRQWRAGRGCGGDDIAGQRAVAAERGKLEKIFADTQLLIIVGGLGGGTCTGGLPVILGVTGKLRIQTMLLLSLPFSMEGFRRKQLADARLISDLLPVADALITLPNDLLFSTLPADTPLAEACELADREIARTALALSAILTAGNLFSADMASFSTVLKRRAAVCAIGVGVVKTSESSPAGAMEKLLSSPLLGGPDVFNRADAAVLTVLGGKELSLADARASLELLSNQLDKSPERTVLLGAGTSDDWQGIMQLTALLIRYLDEPGNKHSAAGNDDSGTKNKRKQRKNQELMQEELPLGFEDKGIMENTTPVFFDDEDLDIPTFKRRGIIIDCGE